jgi:PAS domain S-box-containing protein
MLKLLLIEDNPGDARLIQEMLSDAFGSDAHITYVETLSKAIAYGQNQDFSAILLDLTLPDSTGLDSLYALRERTLHSPIIVLTGNDNAEIGISALQAGAQDYLVKDETSADILKRAVRYAIERHRIEDQVRRSQEEYRSLIEDVFRNSDISIFILDSNLKIVWVNEATELYFGIPREEMIGQSKRDIADSKIKCMFADPDDYITRLFSAYDQKLFSERFECHVLADGNRQDRWLEHWSQPIHAGIYAGGRIEHYMDITHRKRIEAAEAEQRQYAEALRDTLALLTNTLNLNEVLNRILENIGRVVPHHAASVILIDGDKAQIVRSVGDGESAQNLSETFDLKDVAVLQHIVRTGEPINTRLSSAEWQHKVSLRDNEVAYIGMPIFLQDEIIGIINIFNFGKQAFLPSDLDRLSTFARYAAIAIQNAQLYRQSQALAALEERQRLARELHDSVTQTLFSASVVAETAARNWETNPAKVTLLLDKLHRLTSGALAEMRVLLLELRPANLEKVSLHDLLEQLVQSVKSRKALEITLQMSDLPELEPPAKVALYRITQEALNNVVKHSAATQAEICVESTPRYLELSISDNGNGFDLQAVQTTSLGLTIMRERAGEINATMSVSSVAGRGTTVEVIYPYVVA